MPSQPYGECRYPQVSRWASVCLRPLTVLWRWLAHNNKLVADGGVDTPGKERAQFAPGHETVHGAQSWAGPEAIDSPPAAGFGKQPVGWLRWLDGSWTRGLGCLVAAGCRTRDRTRRKQVPSSGSNHQPKKSVWDPLPAQSCVSATHPGCENPMRTQGCRRWWCSPGLPEEQTGYSYTVCVDNSSSELINGSETAVIQSNYGLSLNLLESQSCPWQMDPQFPHASGQARV